MQNANYQLSCVAIQCNLQYLLSVCSVAFCSDTTSKIGTGLS
jgi:hypothetical protein